MPFDQSNIAHGSLQWLRREIGGTLGYGYDPNAWGTERISQIDSYIQAGLMQFYYPTPIKSSDDPKPNKPHTWSFLMISGSLPVKSGIDTYDLPNNFGGVLSEITLALPNGAEAKKIPLSPETTIRQLQLNAPRSGTPYYASISPKQGDGSALQKTELVFYPKPDVDCTASYQYSIVPDALTEDRPFPLGGKQYSNVILQSCLAIAEERLTRQHGPSFENYNTALLAALSWDMQSLQPTDTQVWPLENPADGLKVNRAYLKRLIGAERPCGPHAKTWTHHEANEVEMILQAGLRKFYHPMVLPGESTRHEWSFLRPRSKLTTVSGTYVYDLPDDLAIIDSPLSFEQGSSVIYPQVPVRGEHEVMNLLQRNEASSRPQIAAVRPKTTPSGMGTRFELLLYPVPDGEYTLNYRYQMNPQAGDEETELPYGGQQHAQTVIESCLAASEEYDGKQGVHSKLFIQQLQASVSHDRKAHAAGSLGYNGDPSSDRDCWNDSRLMHGWQANLVTYNGQIVE